MRTRPANLGKSTRRLYGGRAAAALAVLLAVVSAAGPAGQGAAAERPRKPEPVRFSDDFQTDTRPDYQITGKVTWEKGRLVLAEGASIRKAIDAGPTVEVTLDLQWAPLEAAGQQSQAEIGFVLGEGTEAAVILKRTREQAGQFGEIRIVLRTPPTAVARLLGAKWSQQDIRRFEKLRPFAAGPLRVEYCHGLIQVGKAGDPLAAGYVDPGPLLVKGVVLGATARPVECKSLQLAAEPFPQLADGDRDRVMRALQLRAQIVRLMDAGKPREAIPLAKEIQGIFAEVGGRESLAYAEAIDGLAELHHSVQEYTKAEPLLRQAYEIRKKVLGEIHPQCVSSAYRLALLYWETGQYAKAEPLWRQALESQKKVLGEGHADLAAGLHSLATSLWRKGEYAKAEPLLRQVLEIQKKTLGEKNPEYAQTLNSLGWIYREMGKHAQAEPLMLQAAEIYKNARGEEHPEYAKSLDYLASIYQAMGQPTKAVPLMEQSLEILKRAFGEAHPSYVRSLNNLGLLYDDLGEYAKAEPIYLQSLQMRRKLYGETHPDCALALNNLARLYVNMGEYSDAEPLYRQALAIQKKAYGEIHPEYARTLNNLAWLHYRMGEYAQAEPLYQQALNIRKKVLGEAHGHFGDSINDLAVLCRAKGECAEAERLQQRALEIWKRAYGETSRDYATGLSNLALIHRDLGKYAEAEPPLARALEIRRKLLGETHPRYIASLNNLAGLYVCTGEYARAEPLCREALEIRKKTRGETHPDYAAALSNLAGLSVALGQYAEAEPPLRQALEIRKNALGETHPQYALSAGNLAGLHLLRGKSAEAALLAGHAVGVEQRWAERFIAAFSEAESLNLMARQRGWASLLLSAWPPPGSLDDDLYALLWHRRGLIHRVAAGRQRTLPPAPAPELRQLYDEYLETRRALARLTLAPAALDADRQAARRARVAELTEKAQDLERQLAEAVPAFRRQLQQQRRPPADLVERLPQGSVFIDLVGYWQVEPEAKAADHAGPQCAWRYAAFVLASAAPLLRVDLGPGEPIDAAVANWRQAILDEKADTSPALLRRLLWDPLEKRFPAGTHTVCLCP